jgi:hypothetical protein
MDPLSEIRSMVERIVSEVLESRMLDIRHDLVTRVEGELEPLLANRDGAAAMLNVAVNAIQASVSQTEILNSVLDGAANFSSRAVLFVLRGDTAAAWNWRGFPDSPMRNFSIDTGRGGAGEAVRDRGMRRVDADNFLPATVLHNGQPTTAILLPLSVRDRVSAFLYADSGTTKAKARLDEHALQLLMKSAGLWLEVVISRREVAAAADEPQRAAESVFAPAERVSHSAIPAKSPRQESPVLPHDRVAHAHSTDDNVLTAAAPAAARHASPVDMSAQDAEVHARARRFAKLLVDEIKLYNQAKVNEGKQHRDLYERLKEDIDKSRAAYDKRYRNSAAASVDYFSDELVRNLADGEAALLGRSFRK